MVILATLLAVHKPKSNVAASLSNTQNIRTHLHDFIIIYHIDSLRLTFDSHKSHSHQGL